MGRLSAELRIDVHVGDRAPRALPDDVLDGLTKPFKELPPKHLYDARGAELFDQICDLPEYYPTRAERSILHSCADMIVRRTGMAELVELGSGTAAKTRVLLDAMDRAGTLWRYVPFDVAEQTVRRWRSKSPTMPWMLRSWYSSQSAAAQSRTVCSATSNGT